jgi:hypothetical protein
MQESFSIGSFPGREFSHEGPARLNKNLSKHELVSGPLMQESFKQGFALGRNLFTQESS